MRGEVDADEADVEADGGIEAADVDGGGGEYVSGEDEEVVGPGGVFRVIAGVGSEEEAGGHEEAGKDDVEKDGEGFVGRYFGVGGMAVGEGGEDEAEEYLEAEGGGEFWKG